MAFPKIHRRNKTIENLFSDANLSKKVSIYFAFTTFGDDYDKYEKNSVDSKLNPKTIKALVRDVSPEALVYKLMLLERHL